MQAPVALSSFYVGWPEMMYAAVGLDEQCGFLLSGENDGNNDTW